MEESPITPFPDEVNKVSEISQQNDSKKLFLPPPNIQKELPVVSVTSPIHLNIEPLPSPPDVIKASSNLYNVNASVTNNVTDANATPVISQEKALLPKSEEQEKKPPVKIVIPNIRKRQREEEKEKSESEKLNGAKVPKIETFEDVKSKGTFSFFHTFYKINNCR